MYRKMYESLKNYVFISFIVFLVTFLILGCSPKVEPTRGDSQKVIVSVYVKTPKDSIKPSGNGLSDLGPKLQAFVDDIKKITLKVLDSNGSTVYSNETEQKYDITFRFELSNGGNYTLRVEGFDESNNVILSGETTAELRAGTTNNVSVSTEFVNGTLEVITEVSLEVWSLYSISNAKFEFKKSNEQTSTEQSITPTDSTFTVQRALKPAIYDVIATMTFTRRNEYTVPAEVTVNKTFSQEVRPLKTSKLRLKVVFEAGQIAIIQNDVDLPYVPPVENLRATVNWNDKKLNVTWDSPVSNATYFIYKEIKEVVSGQPYYKYELLGSTTSNSFTVENYTAVEHASINGIAINTVLNGKQSGLRKLDKTQFANVLPNPYNFSASYNTDTNVLSISWQHDETGCTYKVYRKSGSLVEQIATTTGNQVSIENFYGKTLWNTSLFLVVAEKENKATGVSINKSSVNVVTPEIPKTSSVMYKLFIRSFYDGDGDGIGDFKGIAQKVDYLKNLGVDTVWLLPFNNSDSYHGYDVLDYYDVEPDYGTYEDLEELVKILNANGIRVVMDVVFNHTSDKHPWFLDAVENTTNSPYWNYYIMTLQDKTGQANWHWKINSKGQKVWYFGLFSLTMPDLNFDNPAVREEIKKVLDFWITVGIDGFRFDAVKHFYGWSWNDGVDQSAAASHELEDHIRIRLPNAVVVGEAYDGDPNVLSKFAPMPVFNFTFMYAITGNHEGKDGLLGGSINWFRSPNYYLPVRHFPFIDNHDLNRFISVLIDQKYSGNQTNGTKQYLLANALLLSLDGMPAVYYGNEIGLRGWKWGSDPWDLPVREPMQWYASQNGQGQTWWTKPIYQSKGITTGNANVDGAIYDDPNDGISVEEQESGKTILNFFKQFISLRKEYPALSLGTLIIERDWKNLIVIKRTYANQEVLVLINLDPTYSSNFTIPAGYRWVWYAFFDGSTFDFGQKTGEPPLSSNTNWTVQPRQAYVFVK